MAFPGSRVLAGLCQQANHPPPILHALNWDIKIFQHCWYFAGRPLFWLPVCPRHPCPSHWAEASVTNRPILPQSSAMALLSNNLQLTPHQLPILHRSRSGVRTFPRYFKSLQMLAVIGVRPGQSDQSLGFKSNETFQIYPESWEWFRLLCLSNEKGNILWALWKSEEDCVETVCLPWSGTGHQAYLASTNDQNSFHQTTTASTYPPLSLSQLVLLTPILLPMWYSLASRCNPDLFHFKTPSHFSTLGLCANQSVISPPLPSTSQRCNALYAQDLNCTMNVSSPRCADGFMGQRCEFKDLDGTYLCKYPTLKVCHHISVSRATIDVVIVFF